MHKVSPESVVLAHHKAAASLWGQGGKAYDDISFGLLMLWLMPRRD
jgi:hypothetical protein